MVLSGGIGRTVDITSVIDLLLYVWNYLINVLKNFVITFNGVSVSLFGFFIGLIIFTMFLRLFIINPRSGSNKAVSEKIRSK